MKKGETALRRTSWRRRNIRMFSCSYQPCTFNNRFTKTLFSSEHYNHAVGFGSVEEYGRLADAPCPEARIERFLLGAEAVRKRDLHERSGHRRLRGYRHIVRPCLKTFRHIPERGVARGRVGIGEIIGHLDRGHQRRCRRQQDKDIQKHFHRIYL